jgi:hypothetical protein
MAKKKEKTASEITGELFQKELTAARKANLQSFRFKGSRYRTADYPEAVKK